MTLSFFAASCLNKTESLCWDFNLEILSWTGGLLIVCDNSNLNLPPKETKELTETTGTRYCNYPDRETQAYFFSDFLSFLVGSERKPARENIKVM